MKTVKVKMVKEKNKSDYMGNYIVNGYVFNSFCGEGPRNSLDVIVIPPANSFHNCAVLIFAKEVYGIKSYQYKECEKTPYINIGKSESNEILKRLPEMIKMRKDL